MGELDEHAGSAARRVEACLAAIDLWQPHVNGMVTITAEAARRDALAADRAAAEGRWLGLLHGLPMVIKDNIDTAGIRTTSGSLFFKDRVPNHDATVVKRLKAAGAVIVGKCTMHEVAFGIRSHNPVTGQARNPYDLSRVPGGSSGGSGIAVATGMAEAALGTDTGGSIRLPAALCGITGLRPTSGRVSNRGCLPVSLSHDTIGPMATTAIDCARIFAATAGYDEQDPSSIAHPLENFLPSIGDGIGGLKIGLPKNFYLEGCAPEAAAAFEASIKALELLGAEIVEVTVPGVETIQQEATAMIFSDACALHAERMTDEALWGPTTIERLKLGLEFSGADYARAVRAREVWRRTLARLFNRIDLLASPAILDEAPPIEDGRSLYSATMSVTKNTYCGAFAGLPGIALPNGKSRNGLPLSLQLEAAWWHEPMLLRAGHAYQSATDWHRMRPEPITC
jgi:aspartyl-tRNA(Asn)/glutamyl-tRNA(Gln) amidotransferase subunit A